MLKRDFEKLLLQAVDEGLSSLGESSRQAIYFHLKKNFNIKKEEIPNKIGNFADAIEKIFGSGADFLEILIMKSLHDKVGGIFELRESTDSAFTEYVIEVKRNFVKKKKLTSKEDPLKEIIQCEEMEIEA